METIPILYAPEENEIFYSYLLRLSHDNGFSEPADFISFVINKDIKTVRKQANMYLSYLLKYIENDLIKEQIVESCYYRSFIYQSLHLLYENKHLNTLRCCPECMEKDKQNLGHPVLYRHHQWTEINSCPIHHIPLRKAIVYENGNFQFDNELQHAEINVEYDSFIVNIPKLSLRNMYRVILSRLGSEMMEIKDLDKALSRYPYFTNDYPINGEVLERFLTNPITPNKKTNLWIGHLLFGLFKTPEKLIECLDNLPPIDSKESDNVNKSAYLKELDSHTGIRPFRVLHIPCRKRFIASCIDTIRQPECINCHHSKYISKQVILDLLKSLNNEWILLGNKEKYSYQEPISLLHVPCGQIQEVYPYDFIFKPKCNNCTLTNNFEAFKDYIERTTNNEWTTLDDAFAYNQQSQIVNYATREVILKYPEEMISWVHKTFINEGEKNETNN